MLLLDSRSSDSSAYFALNCAAIAFFDQLSFPHGTGISGHHIFTQQIRMNSRVHDAATHCAALPSSAAIVAWVQIVCFRCARLHSSNITGVAHFYSRSSHITLKFAGGKLVVTQTGICGVGHNVSAAGTYKKVSAKKPKFGED